MDKVLIRYVNNGSVRYDGKDFLEPFKKIRREKGAKGRLIAGEQVTIKTKTRIWNAIIVLYMSVYHSVY